MQIRRFPLNAPANSMLKVALQYADAMERRKREATSPEWLARLWADVGAFFVRKGQSFLMLRKIGPFYVASHFAPETIRGGYRLLREISEAAMPIIFSVPEDLAVDLERIGWKRLPSWAVNVLRSHGMPDEKIVLVPEGMLKMAWSLLRSGDWYTRLDLDVASPERACRPRRRSRAKKPKSPWVFRLGQDTFRPFKGLKLLMTSY